MSIGREVNIGLVMVWCRTGDKPLHKQNMTRFTATCVHYEASNISYCNISPSRDRSLWSITYHFLLCCVKIFQEFQATAMCNSIKSIIPYGQFVKMQTYSQNACGQQDWFFRWNFIKWSRLSVSGQSDFNDLYPLILKFLILVDGIIDAMTNDIR